MKFRSDIEGLRAIAVVPVVLYHASSRLLPGGYIGVDIFFVISGFLISQIILDGVSDGSFTYSSFYRRRIRRIFPALFFMLCVTSLAALVALPPMALKEFGKTLAATALFVSNMEFYRLSGYFGGAAELKPLLHTWSLAVEEQFYIFFPVVLLATKRWFRGRFLIVIIACSIVSLLMSIWLVAFHPQAAFYLGPPRAFELMIGAVLALNTLPQLSNRTWREAISALGMGMIATSAFAFDKAIPFPGLSALLPCLGAAAIIYAGQSGQSTVAIFLSLPALRFIGAISYSLYLWHWPVLALARNYFPDDLTPVQTTCAVLFAIMMAIISWHFVERPFRTRAHRDKPIFGMAGNAMAGAVALSTLVFFTNGLPERFPTEAQRLFRYSDDFNHRRSKCHDGPDNNIPYADNCLFGAPQDRPIVAVWGDSHGAELSVALGDVAGAGFSVMEITSSACPPALDFNTKERTKCAAHNQKTIAGLLGDRRIHSVILVARYGQYVQPDLWSKFQKGFEKAISELVSSGKRVIVVYPVPVYSRPVPNTLGMMVARGTRAETYRLALSKYREENATVINELNSVTAKYHLQRIATENVFCNQSGCMAYDGHNALYWDDNHLSVSGAKKLAAVIKTLL